MQYVLNLIETLNTFSFFFKLNEIHEAPFSSLLLYQIK